YGEMGDEEGDKSAVSGGRRPYFPARHEIGSQPPAEIIIKGRFRWDHTPEDFENERGWLTKGEIDQTTFVHATHPLIEDVTEQSGIDVSMLGDNWKIDRKQFEVARGGVYACDYNNDGKIDLLITDEGMAKLYEGLGGGRFEDVTITAGLQWQSLPGVMA